MSLLRFTFLVLLAFATTTCSRPNESNGAYDFDVIIAGGGASGVMAGIQSARMGAKTLIVEETVWLGGMLTSAGVSAIDGNYELVSGLWEEFRQKIYQHYGGPDSVKTGWVSHVMFEPHVAAEVLQKMAEREPNLKVIFESRIDELERKNDVWEVRLSNAQIRIFTASIVIDATELGDLLPLVGESYDIGMDTRKVTNEAIAPSEANDIIQDMTYVAILEKFEVGRVKPIEKPEGYDPSLFYCTCAGRCDQDTVSRKLWDCEHMMNYGRLPNNRYMINWPIYGNDYYLNAIKLPAEERKKAFEKAKWFTKCYVYYLQNELGFDDYGIATGVFPTADGFPMIPYHRESRRVKGKVQFTINDLAHPYDQPTKLYRTGIAVGDYPVDHHHQAYPNHEALPDLHFYPVPSYSLPLGALLPDKTSHLIVAEKSISVTNLVNGTTRLQPVCLLIGQAAGALAALSAQSAVSPERVSVRQVQQSLLKSGAYLLPYADVHISDPAWKAIQKIGVTGILKGEGRNVGWRNFTYFHPDSLVTIQSLTQGLHEFYGTKFQHSAPKFATTEQILDLLGQVQASGKGSIKLTNSLERVQVLWLEQGWEIPDLASNMTRKQLAVLLDGILDPFELAIDHNGNIK